MTIFTSNSNSNYKFSIEAASASGYVVLGRRTREMYEDGIGGALLFAGTLDDCLDFIKQEIIKHDNLRQSMPTNDEV